MIPHSHPSAARARRSLWQRLRLPVLGTLAAVGLTAPAAQAVTPIGFTGSYSENFDTLPTTTPSPTVTATTTMPTDVPALPGWQFQGLAGSPSFLAGTGSANSGAVYSFGVAGAGAVTDRTLGALASGSVTGRYGAILRNDSAITYSNFTIDYTGEVWRSGGAGLSNNTANNVTFNYSLSATDPTNIAGTGTAVPALTFSRLTTAAAGAVDGNAAANRQAINGTVTGISWAPGTFLVIRFDDVNDPGTDDALGIDDLTLTASATAVQTNPVLSEPTANPDTVAQGNQTLLSVRVTPGANPTSSGITVVGDLSVIGGSATQPFFDDGTNGDAAADDDVYSYRATVATNATPGTPGIAVRVSDTQNRTDTTTINLTVTARTSPSTTLVISEFRAAGPGNANTTSASDEFVEILNISNAPIDIAGYQLLYSPSTGSGPTPFTITYGPNTVIPAGGYFLFAPPGSSASANANASYSAGIAATGGIGIADAAGNVLDAVGQSTGTLLREGSPVTGSPNTATQSYERNAFGANRQDTQNNAADFGINTANPMGLAVAAAAPTIASFAPTSGPVGTSVVITGTNFTGATQVAFNGTATANFTVDSATQITAVVPMGATTGTITVSTPGGTATSADVFTVVAAPVITSFAPTSGPVGTQVTITGSGFTGATQVAFNGTVATTFNVVSDTQITATVPAGATTGTITVSTPGGTATSPTNFTVVATPTITSFTPASGPVGTSVVITGTNFTGATQVAFNGTAATFTVDSATQITATVPGGATTGTITVTAPGGTATSADVFTVTVPVAAPTIASFAPTSGPVGTSVVITGTGFTGATQVAFNGTPATVFNVDSDTQITATVPTGATTGTITVSTPGGTATSADVFTVTAAPANQAPTVADVAKTTLEDTPVGFTAAEFDAAFSDPDAGDTLQSITIVSLPAQGTLNGGTIAVGQQIARADIATLAYTPGANFNGTDTFQYTASDGQANAATPAGVNITVTAVNDAPSFALGTNPTVAEDAPAQTITGFASAISPGPTDEAAQTVLFTTTPVTAADAALFTAGGQPAISPDGTLTFTPAPNANGTANFNVTLMDNGGTANGGVDTSAAGAFSIGITPVNDAPTISAIGARTTLEDTPTGALPFTVGEVDGDPISVSATSSDQAIVPNANIALGGAFADRTVTVTPAPNANGTVNITVTVSDGALTSSTTFALTVTPVNDAPSFTVGGPQTVNEDAASQSVPNFITAISAGPANEATQSLSFTTTNNNNALFTDQPTITSAGTLGYTPAPNQSGVATVSVVLADNGGTANGGVDTSAVQTFTITINAVNDAPLAAADGPYFTDQGVTLVVPAASGVLANDTDVDSPALTAVLVNDVARGTLTLNPDGSFTYAPEAGFRGTTSFSYAASDGALQSEPIVVTIGVNATPQPISFGVSITPKAPKTNDVLTATPVIFDPVGVSYTYEWSVNGVVRQSGASNTYNLASAGNGDKGDRIVCTVRAIQGIDSGVASNFVNVFNSAPSTTSQAGATTGGVETSFTLTGSDPDLDALTFKRVGGPVNGVANIVANANGTSTLFYTPRSNFGGVETIRFVALDTIGKPSSVQAVTIDVTAAPAPPPPPTPNRAPLADDVTATTFSGVEVAIPLSGSDPDGDPITFKRVGGPRNGTGEIRLDSDGIFKMFYTPRANFAGTETIRFVALDTIGKPSEVATMTIEVIPPASAMRSKAPAPSAGNS